jgi:hypothetical protein
MAGKLGLIFGKQSDLALLLVPVAFLVEHAHGLGQSQYEGAEPRAVGMLMAQADQDAVAGGIAREARPCAAAGVAREGSKAARR